MEIKRCCCTGHRRLPADHAAALPAHIDAALDALYRLGCRDFYTGGAIGFDTLAAQRVIRFRAGHPDVRLILMLPCRDQSRGWSAEDMTAYRDILAECDAYRYVSEEYDEHAMYRRNMEMVGVSDACIAYVTRSASGAGQTLRAAERAGLTVINLANRF